MFCKKKNFQILRRIEIIQRKYEIEIDINDNIKGNWGYCRLLSTNRKYIVIFGVI